MLEPITPQDPAGSDVSFDPDFEKLEAQVRKLESVQGDPVDWAEVVRLGTTILTLKSKDFRVAAYLAVGLFHEQGYPGLTEGLLLLDGLVDRFWATGFPTAKRPRARQNVFGWLIDKLTLAVNQVRPSDHATALATGRALEALIQGLKRQSAGDQAGWTDLTASLDRWAMELEEVAPSVDETPAGITSADYGAKTSPGTGPTPARVGQKSKLLDRTELQPSELSKPKTWDQVLTIKETAWHLRQIQDQLRQLAAAYRQENPAHPEAFRLLRIAVWLMIDDLPPHVDGLTRLPGPATELAGRLADLHKRLDWPALLSEAEANFPEHIFWLDLQRYSSQALASLGREYQPAQRVVIAETSALLRRLPGLAELRFENEQPLAAAETKVWIESIISSSTRLAEASTRQVDRDPWSEKMAQAMVRARELTAVGDLRAAVAYLDEVCHQAPSARGRFLGQMHIANFFFDLDRGDLARRHLLALREEIGRYSLEEWEPTLAVQVYLGLIKSERAKFRTSDHPESMDKTVFDQTLTRLTRLNAVAALDLDQEGTV